MTLETPTLQVAFSVVALTMLGLFYIASFRPTRSRYSGWWCVALSSFLVGSSAYLWSGTDQQVWANPLGNSLLVLGAAAAWAASRALGGRPTRAWQIATAPAAVWLCSTFDDPAADEWAGGTVFLGAMALMFGLSAYELRRLDRGRSQIRGWMAVAASVICGYYALRTAALALSGADSRFFADYLGSQTTTLLTLAFLVSVSFSMSALTHEELTNELAHQAARDELTGLLNRAEFNRLSATTLRRMERGGDSATVILVDLDHFKQVNDTYGHQAGDQVLEIFGAACLASVRETDLAARYGGEEFILLLPKTSPERAEQITTEISASLRAAQSSIHFPIPTASYGIATLDTTTGLDAAIASADAALYRAKVLGRNRAVRADSPIDEI